MTRQSLLHSLSRNHALADGNKRLALAAVIVFYGMRYRPTLTNDTAHDLIMQVATGKLVRQTTSPPSCTATSHAHDD